MGSSSLVVVLGVAVGSILIHGSIITPCMYEQHEEDSGDEEEDKEGKVDVKLGPTIKYSEV